MVEEFFFPIRYPTNTNKPVEKSLPALQERQGHIFETQSQTRIIYDGAKFRRWIIESYLSDESLLELLDASQFPLKDITDEEES